MVRACGIYRGEEKCIQVLVGKPEGKTHLRRPTHGWQDGIRKDFKEVGWEYVVWLNLLHNKDNQWSHVHTVINFVVSKIVANFLTSQENTGFSRRLFSMELVQLLHCSSHFMSGYYLQSRITSVYVEKLRVLQMAWELLWKLWVTYMKSLNLLGRSECTKSSICSWNSVTM
jgi:hypothetical protein